MLEILTCEASNIYKKKISETERSKTMDKYAQMKRFYYEHRLHVHMYSFMYVNPDTPAK